MVLKTVSPSALSAHWRTKNVCGVIQYEYRGGRGPSVSFRVQKLKNQVLQLGQKKMGVSTHEGREKERAFVLPLHFCSIWALNGLDDAYPQW